MDCFILPSPALVCPSRPCAFTSPSCAGDGSSCCCPGRGIGRHGGCRRCWSCSCTCCRSSSSGAPAAEAAHPAAAAPAVAEAARAAKAPAGPPDVAPLIEDYNEAEHGDDGPGPDELVVEGSVVHQSETGLVPAAQAAQSAALQRQRVDIAESVRQAVGSTFGLRMEGLLLGQEEIKHHAVARIHAPAIFNEVYDTSKDFAWAMFGFNTMVLSFFPGADKNNMSMSVGTLMWLSLKLSISIWTGFQFPHLLDFFRECSSDRGSILCLLLRMLEVWPCSPAKPTLSRKPAICCSWFLRTIAFQRSSLWQLGIMWSKKIFWTWICVSCHGGAKNIRNCSGVSLLPCWVGCHCAWAPPAVLRGRSLRWWSASVQHLWTVLPGDTRFLSQRRMGSLEIWKQSTQNIIELINELHVCCKLLDILLLRYAYFLHHTCLVGFPSQAKFVSRSLSSEPCMGWLGASHWHWAQFDAPAPLCQWRSQHGE